MAEPTGDGKLNDHEGRKARLEAARKELEDSFIVMTHLETKSLPASKSMPNSSHATSRPFERSTISLTRSSMWSRGCQAESNRSGASFPVLPHLLQLLCLDCLPVPTGRHEAG